MRFRALQVRLFVLVYLCAVLFSSSISFSQTTGISGVNLDYYRPSIDGLGGFSTESQNQLSGGRFYFGLSQSFLLGPLLEININGTPTRIVDHVYVLDAVIAYAITNFLTVGADIPVYAYSNQTNFNTSAEFTHYSLGDINLNFKFRLLEENSSRPGISVVIRQTLPTGKEDNFLGNATLTPSTFLVVGKDFKYFSLLTNVGVEFIPETTVQGVPFNDRLTYGVEAKVPFWFWDKNLSFVGEFEGQTEIQNPRQVTSPLGFMAGIKKEFKNGLSILAGGGGGWNNAFGNPIARGTLNVGYSFLATHPKTNRVIPPPKTEAQSVSSLENNSFFAVHFQPQAVQPTPDEHIKLQEAAIQWANHQTPVSIYTPLNSLVSQKRVQFVRHLLLRKGVPLKQELPSVIKTSFIPNKINKKDVVLVYLY